MTNSTKSRFLYLGLLIAIYSCSNNDDVHQNKPIKFLNESQLIIDSTFISVTDSLQLNHGLILANGISFNDGYYFYHDNTLGEVVLLNFSDLQNIKGNTPNSNLSYQIKAQGKGPCEFTNIQSMVATKNSITVYDYSQYKIIMYSLDVEPEDCNSFSVPKDIPELIHLYSVTDNVHFLHLSQSGTLHVSNVNADGWNNIDSVNVVSVTDNTVPIPSSFIKVFEYEKFLYVFPDLYSGSYYKLNRDDHSIQEVVMHTDITESYYSTKERMDNFDFRINNINSGT